MESYINQIKSLQARLFAFERTYAYMLEQLYRIIKVTATEEAMQHKDNNLGMVMNSKYLQFIDGETNATKACSAAVLPGPNLSRYTLRSSSSSCLT